MSNIKHVQDYFINAKKLIEAIISKDELLENISHAGKTMAIAIKDGKKIIACGNGGSMCDAMHFASELSGKYKEPRRPYPAIALSDPAAMTCISNDFEYVTVFARQVLALCNAGDVLLAISTSGNSPNVLNAMFSADDIDMVVIGLTGAEPSHQFMDFSDHLIKVPSTMTNHVQELHIKIIHILVEIIEKNLKSDK